MTCLGAFLDLLHKYESVAIWLEGIALVLILLFEEKARREQRDEMHEQREISRKQMDIWRKQIHADRVAEIFKALRNFEHFIVQGVHFRKTVGPGKDFSDSGDYSNKGGNIFKEYLDLQEAYYLSYLVSDPLAAFMKERMAEADGLQRIASPEEFHNKLQEFHKSWDVYKMAVKIRELS
jgi:hypothetical protein